MSGTARNVVLFGGLLLVSLAAPWIFPAYQTQLAFLWLMVLFALSWDIVGGQMGYNSFGNIVYFGIGMYATVVVQRDLYYTVEEYAELEGSIELMLTPAQYLTGLGLGMGLGAVIAVISS